MQVHFDLQQLPQFHQAAITIGTFDGVHHGHRTILSQLATAAAQVQGESVLITFHPHPRLVLTNQASEIRLINTLEERIELIAAAGIDHLVVVPFTAAFATQLPEEYVSDFLVKHFHPAAIVIGYDHRFGKNRAGNFALLKEMQASFGYQLIEIPAEVIENNTVSSTQIRQALLNGDLARANRFLGYTYFFEGTVVEGKKLGRTIGYPTANLLVADREKLIPHQGVYVVEVVTENGGKSFGGMMNIGTRPTVHGTGVSIEVHLFDMTEDLYGKTLRVSVHQKLRDEVKFSGLEALTAQLGKDEAASRAYFNEAARN